MVEASQEDLLKIKDTAGIEIKADVHLSDPDLRLRIWRSWRPRFCRVRP